MTKQQKIDKYGYCDIPNCRNAATKFSLFCREHSNNSIIKRNDKGRYNKNIETKESSCKA